MALPENVGVATATMSWVAWKEGRVDEVEALAQEALESWEGSVRRYPLDWILSLSAHQRPTICWEVQRGHGRSSQIARPAPNAPPRRARSRGGVRHRQLG